MPRSGRAELGRGGRPECIPCARAGRDRARPVDQVWADGEPRRAGLVDLHHPEAVWRRALISILCGRSGGTPDARADVESGTFRGLQVIIGGTKEDDDWYSAARPETTTDILRQCLALCPELVPPEIRAEREGTIEDVRALIVEEGCGFRPQRKGGIRLDVEWVPGRQGKGKVPTVFNYG